MSASVSVYMANITYQIIIRLKNTGKIFREEGIARFMSNTANVCSAGYYWCVIKLNKRYVYTF
jgi:hypothetical protein